VRNDHDQHSASFHCAKKVRLSDDVLGEGYSSQVPERKEKEREREKERKRERERM